MSMMKMQPGSGEWLSNEGYVLSEGSIQKLRRKQNYRKTRREWKRDSARQFQSAFYRPNPDVKYWKKRALKAEQQLKQMNDSFYGSLLGSRLTETRNNSLSSIQNRNNQTSSRYPRTGTEGPLSGLSNIPPTEFSPRPAPFWQMSAARNDAVDSCLE
ncbi:hypothetical protein F53441_4218 [Fusarium austroafricanum]|uniref:Uncharacterized protein n=1 Tax=Fusarium austroafricanum TaxID=2364996 RepID=A0A8H4P9M9_9HYPO|nr:hypothetical protein F53441_4218 [Fusarium austroafricanum]